MVAVYPSLPDTGNKSCLCLLDGESASSPPSEEEIRVKVLLLGGTPKRIYSVYLFNLFESRAFHKGCGESNMHVFCVIQIPTYYQSLVGSVWSVYCLHACVHGVIHLYNIHFLFSVAQVEILESYCQKFEF